MNRPQMAKIYRFCRIHLSREYWLGIWCNLPWLRNRRVAVINRKIRETANIHLMFNEKFSKPYVDFILRNFPEEEHLFLCKRWSFDDLMPFPRGRNVFEIRSYDHYDFTLAPTQRLICHSLFDRRLETFLYAHPELPAKAYWVIWGGDLYHVADDEVSGFVRHRLRGFITAFKGDAELARERYQAASAVVYEAFYLFPLSTSMLAAAGATRGDRRDCLRILINNSLDTATLDMLDELARFRDRDIRIVTISSYGEMSIRDEVIRKGRRLFGDKFSVEEKFMAPAEYARFLAANDLLILNQQRQQGVGNILASLALGCKVFIRSSVSTYAAFRAAGFRIFDTDTIASLSFEELAAWDADSRIAQQRLAMSLMDDASLARQWRRVFERREELSNEAGEDDAAE